MPKIAFCTKMKFENFLRKSPDPLRPKPIPFDFIQVKAYTFYSGTPTFSKLISVPSILSISLNRNFQKSRKMHKKIRGLIPQVPDKRRQWPSVGLIIRRLTENTQIVIIIVLIVINIYRYSTVNITK